MATSRITATKMPAAGKKKEPVAELSEEDASKKAEIDLLVERCQDADHGVQTQALTQLRNELASSTSSMYELPICNNVCPAHTHFRTSVPKALKFLRPHYEVLKALYSTMKASSNKTLLADIVSVLAMSMAPVDSRESLSFKLKGNRDDLESWGIILPSMLARVCSMLTAAQVTAMYALWGGNWAKNGWLALRHSLLKLPMTCSILFT
jgi:26S proteasome regulatory subunit N1